MTATEQKSLHTLCAQVDDIIDAVAELVVKNPTDATLKAAQQELTVAHNHVVSLLLRKEIKL